MEKNADMAGDADEQEQRARPREEMAEVGKPPNVRAIEQTSTAEKFCSGTLP